MARENAGQRTAGAARGRWAMLLAALVALLLMPCVALADPPVPTVTDLGDLDPALFPLLDALLHVQGAPAPGPLRSVTTGARGLTLQFDSLAILLPEGDPDAATALPLVASLLARPAAETLLPDTRVTFGLLDVDAPD